MNRVMASGLSKSALFSNHVPELPQIVSGLGLEGLIRHSISSAVIGYEKPHPEAFRIALALAGDPEEVWMVGDNFLADVNGAEAAGIPAVLVRSPRNKNARYYAGNLLEAAAIIEFASKFKMVGGNALQMAGKKALHSLKSPEFPKPSKSSKPVTPGLKRPAVMPGLEARMIIYIVLLLTILMLITTYMGINRESQGIFDQMQKDGVALARSYALSAENAILLKAGLGRITGAASRTRGIRYLKILDKDRRIIGHTDVTQIGNVDRDLIYQRALNTPITAVEKGKTPITMVDRNRQEGDIFRVIIPLVILDSTAGVLEVGLDMTGISEAVQRTNNQSLVIALAAFLFGGAYIWFFARSLTRPVKGLVAAAERIASGDLDQEITVKTRDEIGHLASSFNHMTRRLREYTGNLKRINAQLEADAATIEKLRRYTENILASIKPGVLTLDLEGRITTLNRSGTEILQLKECDVIGRRITEVFDARERLRSILEEGIISRKLCHGDEISIGEEDGRETLLVLNTAFLYDQNSEIVGLAATFEDITEVRELQKRINESEKLAAMGELAVGIAHEVRNPLGAIKTSAQFLEEKFGPEDIRYRFAKLIVREVERLDQLVERLLNFTRPGEKDFQYEDVNELVENSLTLAVLKVNDQRLVVDKHYEKGIPRLFADAKRLQQAFLNILLNAIDAMPGGGTLTVRTSLESENRSIKIELSDTGEGIPPHRLEKIFTPFFTTRRRGTGLGLAIVHQIISEHNGTIGVQSKVGEGTLFTIRLPSFAGYEEGSDRG